MKNVTLLALAFVRSAIAKVLLVALVLSIGLWVWSSDAFSRTIMPPALSIYSPDGVLSSRVARSGLQFDIWPSRCKSWSVFFFNARAGELSRDIVVQALGFTIAHLPEHTLDGDDEMPRYSALAIPYWFLIAFSGICLLWARGLFPPLIARLRSSRASKAGVAGVLLLFLIMNGIPSIQGHYLGGTWLSLLPEVFDQNLLGFGFPFECLRTVSGDGERADILRRHFDGLLGWKQEKVMENLIIAVLAATAAGLAIERLRNRPQAAMPPAAADAPATSTAIVSGAPTGSVSDSK